MSEADLHKAVADFLRVSWPPHLPWTHVPMGENRGDKITRTDKQGRSYSFSPSGAKLKRLGAAPGWPDLTFLLPDGRCAFIELKARTGSLTPEQAEFITAAKRSGHPCEVCRSLEEVERTLGQWLAEYDLALRARLSGGAIITSASPLFSGAQA